MMKENAVQTTLQKVKKDHEEKRNILGCRKPMTPLSLRRGRPRADARSRACWPSGLPPPPRERHANKSPGMRDKAKQDAAQGKKKLHREAFCKITKQNEAKERSGNIEKFMDIKRRNFSGQDV